MDINVNLYVHRDPSEREADRASTEAIDALAHDLNYWAELIYEDVLRKSIPTKLDGKQPPGRLEEFLRELDRHGDRGTRDPFLNRLLRHDDDDGQNELDRMRETMSRMRGLSVMVGLAASHARGDSAMGAMAVTGDGPFEDLAGCVALAIPGPSGGVTLQFWPVDDAKELLNCIGTAITMAEQREQAPETHEDGP